MEALKRGVVCFELMKQYNLNAKENLYISMIDNVCRERKEGWADVPTRDFAKALRVSVKTIDRMTKRLCGLVLMQTCYIPGKKLYRRCTGIYYDFYIDYTP